MTILVLALAVVFGLLAGVIRGGNFVAMLKTRVYHPEFLASSVVCASVVSFTDVDSDGVIAFVALAGAFAFTLMNLHLVGMVILSIGLALNLFVFILNFETPVRPNALVEAGIVSAEDLRERGVNISGHAEPADGDTVLGILGDTFPIRWHEQVVSIGDLIFLVGLANVTGNLMLGNQRRRYTYGDFFEPAELRTMPPVDGVDHGDPSDQGDQVDFDDPFADTDDTSLDDPEVEPTESATIFAESPTVYPESPPTAQQPWTEPPWTRSP